MSRKLILLALATTLTFAASPKPSVRRFSMIPVSGADGSRVTLGTAIQWSADPDNSGDGTFWYRYRVTTPSGELRLIRDFGPDPILNWTTIEAEGFYQMELTSRDLTSGELNVVTANVYFAPLATNGPAVTPTIHPLVAIYSVPSCTPGSVVQVQFAGPTGDTGSTPWQACKSDSTVNFYVGGMRPQTTYALWHVVQSPSGQTTTSDRLQMDTGTVIPTLVGYAVPTAPAANPASPILLQSALLEPAVATDLSGNVVWYYNGTLSFITRPEGNGNFLGIYENGGVDSSQQLLREIDIAGNTLLETNAARISEQLVAQGKRPITGFHHEARALPNGNILALASTEQILTDVQGPGDVDVIGDMILVLDRNMNVVWTWDAFDHLDASRAAILGEQCFPATAGCAPFYQMATANDWLHGNALQRTADGNLIYSARHQDWVIKIDYEDGAGSGQILWKLGKDGDFQYSSTDPYPWFSHQHDPNFDLNDPAMFYVFDNGNTRVSNDGTANSRGQAIRINEANLTASLVLNADLGSFSAAVGSAAKLSNGNFHFDMGYILNPNGPPATRTVELDATGKIVYEIDAATPIYRTFRLTSLYAPENK